MNIIELHDTARKLHEAGGHLVLLGAGKIPTGKRWQKTPASIESVLDHVDNNRGNLGIIPASLGFLVVDCDKKGVLAGAARGILGQPLLQNPSATPGNIHLWYACSRRPAFTTWPGGDTRYDRGQVVLYAPEMLLAALPLVQSAEDVSPRVNDLTDRKALMAAAPEGERNVVLNFLQYTGGDAVDGLGAAAVGAGLPQDEVRATMESATQAATTQAAAQVARSGAGFTAALRMLGLEYRSNARSGELELRHAAPDSLEGDLIVRALGLVLRSGGWGVLTDNGAAALRELLGQRFRDNENRRYVISKDMFNERVRTILAPIAAQVDPFQPWLEALPPWDGTARLEMLLIDALGADDTPLNRATAERFLIAAVARCRRPGCQHDWIPLLIGGQGFGKSTFAKELLPDGEGLFARVGSLEEGTQKQAEQIQGAVIVEFQEIDWREDRVAKGYLSLPSDNYRRPYAERPEGTPRRWVGIGTSNEAPLKDPTGNRRYVSIRVNTPGATMEARAAHVREYLQENCLLLWAEARDRYAAGQTFHIPGELEEAQRAVNAEFTKTYELLEPAVLALTEQYVGMGEGYSIGGLMAQANIETSDRNVKRFSAELRRFEWEKRRPRLSNGSQTTLWFPPQWRLPEETATQPCVHCGEPLPPDPDGLPLACQECNNRQMRAAGFPIPDDDDEGHDGPALLETAVKIVLRDDIGTADGFSLVRHGQHAHAYGDGSLSQREFFLGPLERCPVCSVPPGQPPFGGIRLPAPGPDSAAQRAVWAANAEVTQTYEILEPTVVTLTEQYAGTAQGCAIGPLMAEANIETTDRNVKRFSAELRRLSWKKRRPRLANGKQTTLWFPP